MDNWYVRVKGRVLGPYSLPQLEQMRDRGQLQAFFDVSTDRVAWKAAGNVDGLFPPTGFTSRQPNFAPPTNSASPATHWLPVKKSRLPLPLLLIVGGVLGMIGILAATVVVLLIVSAGRDRSRASATVAVAPPAERRAPPEERLTPPEPPPAPADEDQSPAPEKPAKEPDGNGKSPAEVKPGGGALPQLPSPPPLPPAKDADEPGIIAFNPQTDPVKRHRAVKNSVGLVLCGLHVTRSNGTQVEIAQSSGTCFAVTPDGLLLTNRHVVEEIGNQKRASDIKRLERDTNAKITPTIWVFFSRSDKHVAEVKYISENYDLAVLKINRKTAHWFALSDKKVDEIVPDLNVTACGFPGVQRDILKTATGKDIQSPRGPIEGQFPDEAFSPNQEAGKVTTEPYEFNGSQLLKHPKCIQHTADIFHGNSGGPLILSDGAVVGINTYGFTIKKGDDMKKVNLSICLPQLKDEINRQIPAAVWR